MLIVLAAAVVVVYLPSLDGQFLNWDDNGYVKENPHLRGEPAEVVRWAFTSYDYEVNWHPLTWLSHALDVHWFGLDSARGHHWGNLVLHTANTVLLGLVVWRLTRRAWVATIAAALFALHPQRVEVVSWVAERKELLAWFFSLLALLAYLHYAARPSVWRYLPVALALVAALLAKPMAVTLPVLFCLMDLWPLRRLSWRTLLEKAPLFVLVAGSCAMTLVAQQAAKAPLESITFTDRLANAAVAGATYLGQALWPAPGSLRPFYSHPATIGTLTREAVIVSTLVLVAVSAMVVLMRRRYPYLLWGWLWYLATLVPVIGIVQVGSQGMADRYTYVPLIGPAVALVLFVADLLCRHTMVARGAAVVALGLLAVLAWLTHDQQKVWADTITLWEYNTAHEPRSYISHLRLGQTYKSEKQWLKAIPVLTKAVQLGPNNLESRCELAYCLAEVGRTDEALAQCDASFRLLSQSTLSPGLLRKFEIQAYHTRGDVLLKTPGRAAEAAEAFQAVLGREPEATSALDGLGRALYQQNRRDEALIQFEKALEINPYYLQSRSNLVRALGEMGRLDDAIEHGRIAVEQNPRDADIRCNLATALRDSGRAEESLEHYAAADRLQSGRFEVYAGWAGALVKLNRPAEAVDQWLKAAALQPKSAEVAYRLALAQHAAGDRDEALASVEKVLQINPRHGGAQRLQAVLGASRAVPPGNVVAPASGK
jgi:tetratricopeptide (TPR) repeat protein